MGKSFEISVFALLIIIQISWVHCQGEVPSFRIIAPQNLCKQDGNETVAKQSDGVTISFQPKDGIKLSYKFKIYFKILGPEPLTQRETLLVWKAVRALEQQLNVKDRLQISKDNMAAITKSQVVPGVSYIFQTIGITDAGETTREQIFTIEYADGVLQNTDVPEGINFLLLGSEEIVANMEYTVVAKVTFCKPKYDYFVQWKLDEIEYKYQGLENTISSTLVIPANVLKADRKTSVEAQVREWETGRVLARDILMVEVLNKGFQAVIVPIAARIGEGSYLTFRIFLKNFDEVFETNIKWIFRETNTKVVLQSQDDSDNEFRVQFDKAGLYQVLANITINGISTRVKSEIEVISSLFISYDFQSVPDLNPSSNEAFKFTVTVMNLVPNCEASWLSAQEDGFKFIASGVLDKEYYGYTKVSNLEKYYLEEIIDFTNSTVSRDITLHIPKHEMKNELSWPGFEGDAMYKFRLDVTCPKPFLQSNRQQNDDDDDDGMSGKEPWQKVVTSYFTIDLHTNSPPQALRLLIQPSQGKALKTIFNVNSQEAKDLLLDSPIRYDLKMQVEQFEINFGKYFEYKTWDVILPFTGKPLEIMVEICDIRQACTRVHNGTKISVQYENLSDLEYEEYVKKVNSLFMRTDFPEAFNFVIMALVTFKNGKSAYNERFQRYAKVLINKEIDKLLEQPANRIYINPDIIHQFVEKSKAVLDYSQQMDKATIEKLIEILDNLMENYKVEEKRFKRESRWRRIVNYKSQDRYQKTQLSLLEDLLKTEELTDESIGQFIEKISKLAQKLCLNDHLTKESLSSSMVSLTLKKLKGNILQEQTKTQITDEVFDKFIVQFKVLDPQMLQKESVYCLVIKSFNLRDYNPEEMSLMQYNIYEILDNYQLKEIQLDVNPGNIQLDIYPSEKRVNKCLMKSSYKTPWSSEACKSSEIGKVLRCSCSQMGFIKTTLEAITSASTAPSSETSIKKEMSSLSPISLTSAQPTFISLTSSPVATFSITSQSQKNYDITTTTSVSLQTGAFTAPSGPANLPPTTPRTSSNIQVKPTTSMQNIQKASPMTYVIPLIFILILLVLGLLFLLHRRRVQQTSMLAKNLPASTILEYRKPATGIKYANIQDDHMLSGNF